MSLGGGMKIRMKNFFEDGVNRYVDTIGSWFLQNGNWASKISYMFVIWVASLLDAQETPLFFPFIIDMRIPCLEGTGIFLEK